MNPAETYILNQPEPFRSMLLQLQVLIENTLPELELLYKWKIPCYYLYGKPFCYLNVSKGYVDVGFGKGYLLQNHLEVLVSKNRTMIKSLRYFKAEDIDVTILSEVLLEHQTYYS